MLCCSGFELYSRRVLLIIRRQTIIDNFSGCRRKFLKRLIEIKILFKFSSLSKKAKANKD